MSIKQMSPSGTHLIGQIFFLVCTLCGSMVPTVTKDTPDGMEFDTWHVDFHRALARAQDQVS